MTSITHILLKPPGQTREENAEECNSHNSHSIVQFPVSPIEKNHSQHRKMLTHNYITRKSTCGIKYFYAERRKRITNAGLSETSP